ncbi:MAG: hypothetical protein ACLGG6_09575, partial [Gammaproteobacteria bacterium]
MRQRLKHPRQVGLELREAGLHDGGEARLHRHATLQGQRQRLVRRRLDAAREPHAALGLADVERQAAEE